MKRFVLAALLAATPAWTAEIPPPRADRVVAALQAEIGALTSQIAMQADQIAQLTADKPAPPKPDAAKP